MLKGTYPLTNLLRSGLHQSSKEVVTFLVWGGSFRRERARQRWAGRPSPSLRAALPIGKSLSGMSGIGSNPCPQKAWERPCLVFGFVPRLVGR